MNRDIRLSVEFWRHPKTKKLIRRTGLEGARSLQILWLWAVVNRPDGDLAGMDDEAIELAADWEGEEGRLAATLVDVAFLDGTTGARSLHGWLEYNAWQTGDSDRANTGRFNVLKSKMKDVHAKLAEAGITSLTKSDYEELKVPSRTQVVVDRLLALASSKHKVTPKEPPSNPKVEPEVDLQATSSLLQVDLSNPLQSPCPCPDPSPSRLLSGVNSNCAADAAPHKKPARRMAKPVLDGWRLEAFEKFWDAYAHKFGRGGAEKAWAAIPDLDAGLVERICDAARKEAARRPAWVAKGMTPKMAQGWLNERRWEDDYDTPQPQPAQGRRPYVPQNNGMKSFSEMRDERNMQACLNVLNELQAGRVENAQEEMQNADGTYDVWTATVDE